MGPQLDDLFQGGFYDNFADKMGVQSFVCRRNTPSRLKKVLFSKRYFPLHSSVTTDLPELKFCTVYLNNERSRLKIKWLSN